MSWTCIINLYSMEITAIFYLTLISTCFSQIVFPGFNNGRLRCEIEKGISGKCKKANECIKSGGLPSINGREACKGGSGSDMICCREPFKIANEVCNAWKSYWRQNDGQCVFEQPLIVGGEEAGVGQFPHIAIIGYQGRRSLQWICGGTLVSPHFILTAAHCVLEYHNFVVRLGEHDIYNPDETKIPRLLGQVVPGIYGENDIVHETRNEVSTEQTIKVAEVIIYPEYDTDYHDIALLRLEKPAVLTKRVIPACLPIDPTEDFNNMDVTAAGWGRIRYSHPNLTQMLQRVKIPTIDRLSCQEQIANINNNLVPKGIISSQLCAGELDKDTCKGDSGGPLVLQLSGAQNPCEHTVAGIVSFGPGCGILGVYTRVSSYIEWITKYIAPKVIPVS